MKTKMIILVVAVVSFILFISSSPRRYSFIYRLAHPSYSSCRHCGMPWSNVEGHNTYYTERSGCFPLCEKCWGSLNIEERLRYYRELWLSWDAEYRPDWELIEKAVKEGK